MIKLGLAAIACIAFGASAAAPGFGGGAAAGAGVGAKTGAVVGLGSMLAKGEIGLAALKKYSFISGKVIARDRGLTVYSGFRDPVFQVVLWGAMEKPDRVLVEYEPKKQSISLLEEFNSDWNFNLPAAKGELGSLGSFSKENADHLGAYCDKLPANAHCEVRSWVVPSGRVTRLDLQLAVGPQVPKAIEFERRR